MFLVSFGILVFRRTLRENDSFKVKKYKAWKKAHFEKA